MASLSATTSSACRTGQGIIALSAVGPPMGATGQVQYYWTVTDANGTDYGFAFDDSVLPIEAQVPDGTYAVRVYGSDDAGASYVSTPRSYTLACSGTSNPGNPGGGTPGQPIIGCMAANAYNYDPTATQDTNPSSCVFVLVDTAPSGLVAAHLPIPVQVRAAPTLNGAASIVTLLLSTAPDLSTPAPQWTEFTRLRTVCDDQGRAFFNLSEAAKSLLRIQPPVEDGADPALSALLRIHYQVTDPETLEPLPRTLLSTCRVLNAVVQSSSGATLTSPTTYTSVPDTGQLWQSVATYAGGVNSTLLSRPADGCQARQFVWLNAAGAWDQGLFFGRHVHGTDQADGIVYRDLAGTDRYASRGTVRETLQVYSDITDWATYKLLRGIRQGIQAYERVGPGQYVPVLLTAGAFPEYTEQTDKTFQVNFTVSYPAQLIQTQ